MIKINLKELLKEKNMTLSELSKVTGITMKTLSSFQNQKVESVQFNTIEQITYALDISVEDLIVKVTQSYVIKVELASTFSLSSSHGAFIVKWYDENQCIFTSPSYFKFIKYDEDQYNRFEFVIEKINNDLPKNIFSMPYIAEEYFTRTSTFYNKNSYLELISYLLTQEFIKTCYPKAKMTDQFIVNTQNIVPYFKNSSLSKDEARFTDIGNVFINNQLLYPVQLTALDNEYHLKEGHFKASTPLTANIESLERLDFISVVEVEPESYERIVYTLFE